MSILYSLRRRLQPQKSDKDDKEVDRIIRDFDNHIETGFQLATFQGPLCAEPVEGLAYFVEQVEIDRDGLSKEMGAYLSSLVKAGWTNLL